MTEQEIRQTIIDALAALVDDQPDPVDEDMPAAELLLDCGGGIMVQTPQGEMFEIAITPV
jgi:hypothetical protein